jgi:hypothetical protein
MEWVTILALLVGPVLAVIVTRYVDSIRAKHERRMTIFRALMATRRAQLSPEHVGALNLVEIEFHGETPVIEAWKNYFSNLSGPAIYPTATPQDVDQFVRARSNLLTKLLHAIATSLKFKMEQLDIDERGYAPTAWFNDENTVRQIRTLALEVLQHKRGLPVTPLNLPAGGPYPAPPELPNKV